MAATERRLRYLRGKRIYEDKMPYVKGVAGGAFEGVIPHHQARAQRLVAVDEALTPRRRTKLLDWLGRDPTLRVDQALERMEDHIRDTENR